jgi:hypothetical protein
MCLLVHPVRSSVMVDETAALTASVSSITVKADNVVQCGTATVSWTAATVSSHIHI